MATTRLITSEIRDAVKTGTLVEGWTDFLADARSLDPQVTAAGESEMIDDRITAAADLFDRLFPGRNWGWQDIDKMITDRFKGEWRSAAEYARYRLSRDRAAFKPGTDGEVDPVLYILPELGLTGGTHFVQMPNGQSGILVFHGITTVADVLR